MGGIYYKRGVTLDGEILENWSLERTKRFIKANHDALYNLGVFRS